MKNKRTLLSRTGGFCLLGIFLLAGCRTSNVPATGDANLLKAEEYFFQTLQQQAFQYQTFVARVQLEFVTSEKNFSSRANLKIRKNSRIQLSIQPLLGIEVFRIELSPDSVMVIDRMNKRYLSEAFSQIKGEDLQIDFNFYNLQALFTNQLFLPGEAELPENAFKRFLWKQTEAGYSLQTEDHTKLKYVFMADRQEQLYASKITDASAHHALHWNYTDFRPVGAQLFPMKINAGWFVGEESKGSLSLNYSHIDINVPVEINLLIPSGYERIDFSQLLKMLEKT
ncbi:MAG: DUF4292 domain-containing protein [Tannerella sp.]|nr:DUF4292 domain-containing protein [Tannerella sp.]